MDGVTRDVYEDADGRQWVFGYDGVWLPSADEPLVVRRDSPHSSAVTDTSSSAGPHASSSFISV